MRILDVLSFDTWHNTGHADDNWVVVTDPLVAQKIYELPRELRYLIAVKPSRHKVLVDLLERGCGVGICSRTDVPAEVSKAVHDLSILTQEGLMHPWVERLLARGDAPLWNKSEAEEAREQGIDFEQAVEVIRKHQGEYKRFALVRQANSLAEEADEQLFQEWNAEIKSLHAEELARHLAASSRPSRDAAFQSSLMALLVIGPVTHLIEWLLPGLGKAIAALSQSVFVEARSAIRAHSTGSAWWQIRRKLMPIAPMAVVGLVIAGTVQSVMSSGLFFLAGSLFGLATIAIPVSRLYQRIVESRLRIERLKKVGKMPEGIKCRWYAGHEGALRLCRALALGLTPLVSALIFGLFPQQAANGWLLACLGLFPWLASDTFGFIWLRWEAYIKDRAVDRFLKQAVISTNGVF